MEICETFVYVWYACVESMCMCLCVRVCIIVYETGWFACGIPLGVLHSVFMCPLVHTRMWCLARVRSVVSSRCGLLLCGGWGVQYSA